MEEHSRTCVVTVTYYPDISDIRFHLALDLCKLATRHKIHLIVVDGSPDHVTVRDKFLCESDGYVHVFEQNREQYSGKGGSIRQAISKGTEWIVESNSHKAGVDESSLLNESIICFTEPEKVDLMNHVEAVVRPILRGEADVVVPTRNDELFRRTYPIEQYHSESFGNLHFNLLAKKFQGFQAGGGDLDWLFGPFAFKAALASSWLSYSGNSWDAQMVPYVRGVRKLDWKISSVTINFSLREEMKRQEEGDPVWTTKRLHQLDLLFDLLGKQELSP